MEIILKFKFVHSRSINFKEAIRFAKNFDNFLESDSGYQLEISKSELFEKWDYFAPFHHYVTRWAGTQVWFNDKLIAPYKNDIFYSIQEIYYCIKAYNNSYDKENYCYDDDKFRGWGCVRIKSIRKNIAFYLWNYWYKYGKFIEDAIWEIDKKKILEIITNESIVNCSNICPYFSISKIINSVDQLPNIIDLTKDKGWEIVYAMNFCKQEKEIQ